MSPSSERPNADQPRPMTCLAPSGSTGAPTPPTMRARTALTRPARPAMIPITIAPVLIPPLALPRSADFTSFVAMIHLPFFSLLGHTSQGLSEISFVTLLKKAGAMVGPDPIRYWLVLYLLTALR